MNKSPRSRLSGYALALLGHAAPASQTVTLLPSQDTPIYADDGVTTFEFASHSNGAGETLYVGTNGTGSARRSLIQFDLSVLPPGTVAAKAKLTLFCDREPGSEYETLSLHAVGEAWTTGGSNSDALGTPGQGAPAEPGDSTWYYRSWPGPDHPDGLKWSQPGASFDPAVIASQQVGPLSIGGDQDSVYTWSSPAMVANVNAWLADPDRNFGWIMTGNETQTRSVKRFISREGRVNNWLKPNLVLTVDIPAGAPATVLLMSSANPADFAQSFDLAATVLGGNAPTGTVTFKDGEADIAGCSNLPLAAGRAVCRIKKLSPGSYAIAAYYSGDSANPAVASKVLMQDVDEAKTLDDSTTWIVATSSANPSAPGESVGFSASMRGGLGPAGTVTFLDGSQVLCNAVPLSHRTALCTTSRLSRGKHRIVALYSGDGTNHASSSAPLIQLVQAQTCTLASRPLLDPLGDRWRVHAGQELRLTVTASDCLKRPVSIEPSTVPPGATFTQSYDATLAKQTGILSWTPGLDFVERTRLVSFKATVEAGGRVLSSAAQTSRITVLSPLPTGVADPVADAAVAKLTITKTAWAKKKGQLTVLGQIRWKPGTSRLVRAAAIAETVQMIDSTTGVLLAETPPRLAGSWKTVIPLPAGTTPPAQITAEFRGTASPPRKVGKRD